ncbi:hypothetical protein BJ875DRAFT_111739 [Amylocarpus encephaloides]|uniref:FAD-binding domain-containing protein n=1 Tax=Amylocarpus encephaloides TaxID=45428 RepID=A0A9P8C2K8_9HELO|nr:hypothetical protein BJ875DRAFT_111739 [Amylocarpus encephaloides]
MADQKIKKIIIVGAGPSGLILAILLAQSDIPVLLLDAALVPNDNPRAAHYAPSSVRELRRCGVLAEVQQEGFIPEGVCWRKPDGEVLGGIKSDPSNPDSMVCLPLDRLILILLRRLGELANAELRWGWNVVGVKGTEEGDREASVTAVVKGGEKVVEKADYVVGCDGANSSIRKCLFGDSYPGETLSSQIIATNVFYDFHRFQYWDSQFIIHPTDWYMAAKITPSGLWRVTYGDIPGLTTEQYLERQEMRFEQILPGHPKKGEYRVVNRSPYKLQQRCVGQMRKGRVLLAADAAHLCNPFGGMGLTGGIADISTLFDCLLAIHTSLTTDAILDKYSEVRIKKWKEVIDPSSRANFRRIWDEEEGVRREREEYLERCRTMESNVELRKVIFASTYMLDEDMTPYFTKPTS